MLSVLTLGVIVGCTKKEKKIEKNNQSIITDSSIETEPESINNNDTKYTIKTKSIVTNNIHVSYPQITGLNNSDIQNKWNNIIRQKVEAGINNIGTKDTYVLSYKVKTQNEKMISLLMLGETSTAATDYDKYVFKYTYNIDIETGDNIRLKDSVDTEKIATNLLKRIPVISTALFRPVIAHTSAFFSLFQQPQDFVLPEVRPS